jgi:hypothetical protein
MRKELVLAAGVIVLLAAAGVYWYFWMADDVSIASVEAPDYIGIKTTGMIQVMLMNKESHPVNVSIDVENAFVGPDGISHSFSDGTLITLDPEEPDKLQYRWVDPNGEITLQPGENIVEAYIGYYIAEGYDLNVKIYRKDCFLNEAYRYGWLLDEATTHVEVLETVIPDLSVKLNTEMVAIDGIEIHRMDAYVLNNNTIRGSIPKVAISVSVIDTVTGDVILNQKDTILAYAGSTTHLLNNWNVSSWNISDWDVSPSVVIELSPNASSPYLYRPMEHVIRGTIGDSYRVNVTAVWEDQVISRELLIPPS